MSDEEEKLPVKVDIGLSAKAEVKGEIPSQSMGRLIDALTDAIRPFTERQGLRADQIRLQREDVLIKIAQKAHQRLQYDGITLNPIPNRVLVPLLEKASLSDIEDETLIGAWANLLASASRGNLANNVLYSDILSKLDRTHLDYLGHLYTIATDRNHMPDEALAISNNEILKILKTDKSAEEINAMSGEEWEKIADEILKDFDICGLKILSGFLRDRDIGSTAQLNKYPEYIIQALNNLGITENVRTAPKTWSGDSEESWVLINKMTYLGFDFYYTCNGLNHFRDDNENFTCSGDADA